MLSSAPSIRPAEMRMEKSAQPLVYISLGTVVNDQLAFYQQCVAALADGPCRVILSIGEQVKPAALGTLPATSKSTRMWIKSPCCKSPTCFSPIAA